MPADFDHRPAPTPLPWWASEGIRAAFLASGSVPVVAGAAVGYAWIAWGWTGLGLALSVLLAGGLRIARGFVRPSPGASGLRPRTA